MTTPRSHNLHRISPAIRFGRADAVVIGDSNFATSVTPRRTLGIKAAWKPNAWTGFFVTPHSVSAEGSWTAGYTLTDKGPPTDTVNGVTIPWPGLTQYETFASNLGDGSDLYKFVLSDLTNWGVGNWPRYQPMRARLIFRRLGTEPATATVNLFRNGGTAQNSALNYNIAAGDPELAYVDADFPAPNGTNQTELQVTVRSVNGTDETGKEFWWMGCYIWNPNATTGFSYGNLAMAGYNSKSYDSYPDAMFDNYFAMRPCNLAIIMLGTGMADDEWNGSSIGDYAENINALVVRMKARMAAAGETDPMCLLICPHETDNNVTGDNDRGRFPYMAAALRDVSASYSDRSVGFINTWKMINDRYGSYATWRNTFTSDGVHLTAAGSLAMARLEWEEIVRATSLTGMTARSMAVIG